uniref:Uncharacterized protein n=1 Tax=Kalanchoe fedtschenkoi TaxID=63787 RepID=A0A7N0VGX7_KALFE
MATEDKVGIRIDNPFAFKVGQVFTGFGVGCGVGIGVGRPINLGAIPMIGQVMSATRGAADALSGAGRHVNTGLRKLGAKSIEAGIGCGVGFGHGFGVGLAVKPTALHQVQTCVMQAMMKMMVKFNIAPNMLLGQSNLPMSLQSGMSMTNQLPNDNLMQMATSLPNTSIHGQSKNNPLDTVTDSDSGTLSVRNTPADASFGRTEKVLNSFLQSPLLNDTKSEITELVVKHQQIIEELMEENEKLRQILVEDLKVPISKLQQPSAFKSRSPCNDCFECRRKQRRR